MAVVGDIGVDVGVGCVSVGVACGFVVVTLLLWCLCGNRRCFLWCLCF